MIDAELYARIRRLFFAEHWKVGTIATELGLHPDTVRRALETERSRRGPSDRTRLTDPYLDFLRQTLQQYPRLRATRLFQMLQTRGYPGSLVQLRRVVAQLRPRQREAFRAGTAGHSRVLPHNGHSSAFRPRPNENS